MVESTGSTISTDTMDTSGKTIAKNTAFLYIRMLVVMGVLCPVLRSVTYC